jgi:hypothetical protein
VATAELLVSATVVCAAVRDALTTPQNIHKAMTNVESVVKPHVTPPCKRGFPVLFVRPATHPPINNATKLVVKYQHSLHVSTPPGFATTNPINTPKHRKSNSVARATKVPPKIAGHDNRRHGAAVVLAAKPLFTSVMGYLVTQFEDLSATSKDTNYRVVV